MASRDLLVYNRADKLSDHDSGRSDRGRLRRISHALLALGYARQSSDIIRDLVWCTFVERDAIPNSPQANRTDDSLAVWWRCGTVDEPTGIAVVRGRS